ncbi:MAG: phosphatase PAP2 family protein [gamma proteobacterium endosymbiont of Lamellibrachia anaximandri]|nr:phosphatase PAP2 family protein [gamma proteobacterium endosymbiont of Lamellibrachia anaximandri]MBL3619587.1 phosphatase PAP2 family protein [gamma proteobacterium endosymbiont of Lamellibrachia anaximandri]
MKHLFDLCNEHEITLVRKVVQYCEAPPVRKSCVLINHLGNGWIYLMGAAALLAWQGSSSQQALLAALLATGIAHCIYPTIKRRLARLRPCDLDPTLDLSIKAMDRYSCPSGHVMTATSVGIPLGFAFPSLVPMIAVAWILIAWARLALGHHYPSDLLVGALFGAAISLPMGLLLI